MKYSHSLYSVPLLLFFIGVANSEEGKPIIESKRNNVESEYKEGMEIVTGMRFNVTINERPPYYKGDMPLVFSSIKKPTGFGDSLTTKHVYPNWVTEYGYRSADLMNIGIASIAKTTNKSGVLLAEAKLIDLIWGESGGEGVRIEETHFAKNGDIVFKCESQFDAGIGFKRSEVVISGNKKHEYYLLWPVSNVSGL